jgi:hypothetical protein
MAEQGRTDQPRFGVLIFECVECSSLSYETLPPPFAGLLAA